MYKTLVYTLVNGNLHLRTCTSKTAKITKGDIARITLTACQIFASTHYQTLQLLLLFAA